MGPDLAPGGFDQSFAAFQSFFWIVFVVIVGAMLFQLVRGAAQGITNHASPEVSAQASIVDKRTATRGGGDDAVRQDHFVTFEQSSGERFELQVPARDYGMLVVGDRGTVSMKGTRFLGFSREILR